MPIVRIPDVTYHGGSEDVSVLAAIPWWLSDAGHQEALQQSHGEGITVAVLDSGFDVRWQQDAAWAGRFVGPVMADDNGHGTHVAGIIGRVAPKAKLRIFKVFDHLGSGTTRDIALAFRRAVDAGVEVINFSGGASMPDDEMEQACEYASQHKVLSIVASGNAGPNRISFPANWETTTSVAAHDEAKEVAPFSSPSSVDCAAAGVMIESNWLRKTMMTASGTSMACPNVSGGAALYLSLAKKLGLAVSDTEFLADLFASATDIDDPGKDVRTGSGAIHFQRLLQRLRDRALPPPPPPFDPWSPIMPVVAGADGKEYALCAR